MLFIHVFLSTANGTLQRKSAEHRKQPGLRKKLKNTFFSSVPFKLVIQMHLFISFVYFQDRDKCRRGKQSNSLYSFDIIYGEKRIQITFCLISHLIDTSRIFLTNIEDQTIFFFAGLIFSISMV